MGEGARPLVTRELRPARRPAYSRQRQRAGRTRRAGTRAALRRARARPRDSGVLPTISVWRSCRSTADDHHVADRKAAFEPFLVAERLGKQLQPRLDLLDDLRPAFLRPLLAAVEDVDVDQLEQHRLDAVQRRDQPGDRPHPLVEVAGKQALVLKAQVDQDRAALEQMHVAVRECGHLPERLLVEIIRRTRVHRVEQSDPVGPLDLLERPADAQVADQPSGEVRNPAESRNLDRGCRIDRHGALPLTDVSVDQQ